MLYPRVRVHLLLVARLLRDDRRRAGRVHALLLARAAADRRRDGPGRRRAVSRSGRTSAASWRVCCWYSCSATPHSSRAIRSTGGIRAARHPGDLEVSNEQPRAMDGRRHPGSERPRRDRDRAPTAASAPRPRSRSRAKGAHVVLACRDAGARQGALDADPRGGAARVGRGAAARPRVARVDPRLRRGLRGRATRASTCSATTPA